MYGGNDFAEEIEPDHTATDQLLQNLYGGNLENSTHTPANRQRDYKSQEPHPPIQAWSQPAPSAPSRPHRGGTESRGHHSRRRSNAEVPIPSDRSERSESEPDAFRSAAPSKQGLRSSRNRTRDNNYRPNRARNHSGGFNQRYGGGHGQFFSFF